MKIALINIDSKIPNLALMKISAFHKAQGDSVSWFNAFEQYDKVYSSKVFSYSKDYDYYPDDVIKGGSGYISNDTVLPDEIEHTCPDYSLYPDMDYSMGFITRGCIRTCNFCIVPKKEGYIRPNADIDEFVRHKNLVLLDNNVLASDFGLKQIEKIIDCKIKADFNQGLDARIIADNPAIAELLSKVKWLKPIRMAMDNMGESEAVIKSTELLRKYSATPREYSVYVIVRTGEINDAIKRVEICRKLNLNPFAQPYLDPRSEKYSVSRDQRDFVSWVNQKAFFKKMPWELFKIARHNRNANVVPEEKQEKTLNFA
ncbi:MAG: radical SAM protein [bacterium]